MAPDGPISFARGAPSPDIMPAEELRACADRALSQDAAGALSYGTASGYAPLRDWIAELHRVEADQVLVTNGSMQADSFLFQHLVEPGDAAVVEAPTYDRTLLMLRELGAEIVGVPMQPDGIDVGGVRAVLEGGVQPVLAHIIPNFHNPAGYTLSGDKRRELVALAAEHDFILFEDDPYVLLDFGGGTPPRMIDLDDGENVVYASSFSKTVSPGVRVGYLVGPVDVISDLTALATRTYISPNMLAQAVVCEFCRSGEIFENVERVKVALKGRRDALAEALRENMPDARFVPPEGGYFMWVELPEGVDVGALLDEAKREGVVFVKGTDFCLEGGDNALRLAFSAVTEDEIAEGVRRLARAYDSVRAGVQA